MTCNLLIRAGEVKRRAPATLTDMRVVEPDDRCPCGTGEVYGQCCGPILAGERTAPTAEALMRSRFSAFVTGDRDYVVRSWHPHTRPRRVTLDEDLDWYRLDVESSTAGGPFDTAGEVTFTAHHRNGSSRGSLHEHSRFTRVDGAWVYLDGVLES